MEAVASRCKRLRRAVLGAPLAKGVHMGQAEISRTPGTGLLKGMFSFWSRFSTASARRMGLCLACIKPNTCQHFAEGWPCSTA